jgi:hypothetical protein
MTSKKDLATYVRNNIEDYETRLQSALDRVDEMRCPLRMADNSLYDEIVDAVTDWCDDNDVSLDFFEDWDELIEGDEGIIWED